MCQGMHVPRPAGYIPIPGSIPNPANPDVVDFRHCPLSAAGGLAVLLAVPLLLVLVLATVCTKLHRRWSLQRCDTRDSCGA